ncbi:MAG: carboxypeptidase-like regulatory domain-containing protein [Bacteroidia bacterium]
MQQVSGTVLDKSTRQPLDSVFAHKDSKDFGEYTDNSGEFKLNEISGGCRGCPPMNVVLTKEGYEQSTVKIKNEGHDTIYLTKKK